MVLDQQVAARSTLESSPGDLAPSRVRVLVAEDDILVRSALLAVLDRDPRVSVVGAVDSIQSTLQLLGETPTDVVLADLFLKDGTACQLGEHLRRQGRRTRLVVTTYFAAGAAAAACQEAGASLCLDRRRLGDRLGDALVTIAAGRPWHGPGVVEPERENAIVFAEAQVLAGVASGQSDAEIARRLGYSQTYVKKMLVSARVRLGARDRAHAAAMAAVLGLVRPVGPARFAAAMPSKAPGTAHRRVIDLTSLVASEDEPRRTLLSKTGSRG